MTMKEILLNSNIREGYYEFYLTLEKKFKNKKCDFLIKDINISDDNFNVKILKGNDIDLFTPGIQLNTCFRHNSNETATKLMENEENFSKFNMIGIYDKNDKLVGYAHFIYDKENKSLNINSINCDNKYSNYGEKGIEFNKIFIDTLIELFKDDKINEITLYGGSLTHKEILYKKPYKDLIKTKINDSELINSYMNFVFLSKDNNEDKLKQNIWILTYHKFLKYTTKDILEMNMNEILTLDKTFQKILTHNLELNNNTKHIFELFIKNIDVDFEIITKKNLNDYPKLIEKILEKDLDIYSFKKLIDKIKINENINFFNNLIKNPNKYHEHLRMITTNEHINETIILKLLEIEEISYLLLKNPNITKYPNVFDKILEKIDFDYLELFSKLEHFKNIPKNIQENFILKIKENNQNQIDILNV